MLWTSKSRSVYAGAALCIAAASGNDANAGLPRIRSKLGPCFEPIQISSTLRGMTLADSLPTMFIFDRSVWNTRAWTYQERALAKRILFITDRYVYFQCIHGKSFGEDMMNDNEFENDNQIVENDSRQEITGLKEIVNFRSVSARRRTLQ